MSGARRDPSVVPGDKSATPLGQLHNWWIEKEISIGKLFGTFAIEKCLNAVYIGRALWNAEIVVYTLGGHIV